MVQHTVPLICTHEYDKMNEQILRGLIRTDGTEYVFYSPVIRHICVCKSPDRGECKTRSRGCRGRALLVDVL
jgi:hypothetical protein